MLRILLQDTSCIGHCSRIFFLFQVRPHERSLRVTQIRVALPLLLTLWLPMLIEDRWLCTCYTLAVFFRFQGVLMIELLACHQAGRNRKNIYVPCLFWFCIIANSVFPFILLHCCFPFLDLVCYFVFSQEVSLNQVL